MKQLVFSFVLLLLFGGGVAGATQSTPDSFTDILAYGYEHNPELRSARAELAATKENIWQARSDLQPTVTGNGNIEYSHTDTDGTSFFTSDGDNFSKSVSVDVSQPVFRGGTTWANIRQSSFEVQAQAFALSAQEQTFVRQVATVVSDVHLAQKTLRLNENNIALLSQELDKARVRFQVGEITKTDVAQAESTLAAAQADFSRAQSELARSRAEFQSLVVMPVDFDMPVPILNITIPDTLDEALDIAETNNRSIIQAKLQQSGAEQAIHSVRGELLPQVTANGKLSRIYDQSDFVEEQDQAIVGLTASIPLYRGGATHSRLRQNQKRLQQYGFDVLSARNEVASQVTQAWNNWRATKTELTARLVQIDAARIAREGVAYEAEYGERTTLDTLEATQDLLAAEVALAQATRDEIISRFTIAEYLGLLVPQNLGFQSISP